MATSETKALKQAVAEGINLLAQGKRNLLCGEVHQAVNQLEEAARIFSKEYGELANECADVYFLYGQALLELHRSESDVLEDCPQSDSSEEDHDDDDDDDDDKAEEKISDAESDTSEDIANEDTSNDLKTDNPNVSKSNGEECQKGDVTSEKDVEIGCIAKSGNEQNEDEDISSLQLSWETLELAKLIYLRQESPEVKLKLADTYSKLGDVGLEMEQFEEAIKDYKECLQIQESVLPKDCRRIAETLYQLGVAHHLHKTYDTSCNYFRASINVMDVRQKRLQKVAAGEILPDSNDDGDGFYSPVELAAKEVEELTQLMKEVLSKIEEVEDEKNSAPNVRELLKESLALTQDCQADINNATHEPSDEKSSSQSASTSSSVHVITHLVRKKRPLPEALEECEVKKQRTDDTSDGTSSKPI